MNVLLIVLLVALSGLAIKFYLDRLDSPDEITWKEYAVGFVLMSLVMAPLTSMIGVNIAKKNNLSFNEFWNGWELSAEREDIPCRRDGSCRWDYACDVYYVPVIVSCGKNCTTVVMEARYHSCPYVTVETSYWIVTSLGNYDISSHRFPSDPQNHRWRGYESIPQYVIDSAGTGIPPFWAEALQRISSGHPGPVSKRMRYDNYILASDQTILHQYSPMIDQFVAAKTLPAVQSKIHDWYYTDKVMFVNYSPTNAQAWQTALMYFNAALGTDLQGDLHLVIAQVDTSPDDYALALKSYWQDPKRFGRNTLSKNGVLIVLGTDGIQITWARAMTGMPLGNELMLTTLEKQLKGVLLTPDRVLGTVSGEFYFKEADGKKKLKVKSLHEQGVIERVVWGLDNPSTKFQRVNMGSKNGKGGFSYLERDIQLTSSQKTWINIVTFLTSMSVWVIFVFIGKRN